HVFGWPTSDLGDDRLHLVLGLIADAAALLSLLLLVFGAYTFVRSLLDLALVRTITGEVLWQELWKSTNGTENRPSRPWLHYLAVDDGSGDRTTAWGLPSEFSGLSRDGDTVTIQVRPWS